MVALKSVTLTCFALFACQQLVLVECLFSQRNKILRCLAVARNMPGGCPYWLTYWPASRRRIS